MKKNENVALVVEDRQQLILEMDFLKIVHLLCSSHSKGGNVHNEPEMITSVCFL